MECTLSICILGSVKVAWLDATSSTGFQGVDGTVAIRWRWDPAQPFSCLQPKEPQISLPQKKKTSFCLRDAGAHACQPESCMTHIKHTSGFCCLLGGLPYCETVQIPLKTVVIWLRSREHSIIYRGCQHAMPLSGYNYIISVYLKGLLSRKIFSRSYIAPLAFFYAQAAAALSHVCLRNLMQHQAWIRCFCTFFRLWLLSRVPSPWSWSEVGGTLTFGAT